jgi:NTE family protein
MTTRSAPSFFRDLGPAEVTAIRRSARTQSFAAGSDLLVEGQAPTELRVITEGLCGVLVRDESGAERAIGQLGPGATIGESALFEDPDDDAAASPVTLRALTDVETIALDPTEFLAVAAGWPQVQRNVGAILADRLTRSYEHAVAHHGRLTVIVDAGGRSMLAYALAASVAWHTRASTALAVIGDPPSDLAAFAGRSGSGACVLLLGPADAAMAVGFESTLEDLTHDYRHVLVLVTDRVVGELPWSSPARTRMTPLAGDTIGDVVVPAFGAADDESLRRGFLGTATPAGAALGWLARDLSGLKVGLALGAGSVRGYAHYGVLQVFEQIGLRPDYVTGTSIGAIVAAGYALGESADDAARIMEETSARAFRLTVPVHSLLSNSGVAGNFRHVSGDTRIEDLRVPLALVAADIETGREVVIRRGLLRVALLASMAIPGIYPPVRIGECVLVDGGVVNPVPISVAAAMGADAVIAVPLGAPATDAVPDLVAEKGSGKLPAILHTISRSIEVMQGRIGAQSAAAATVTIRPDFSAIPPIGIQSFSKGRPYIAPGAAAAEAALPALREALPWLRPEHV